MFMLFYALSSEIYRSRANSQPGTYPAYITLMTEIHNMQRAGRRPAPALVLVAGAALLVLLASTRFGTAPSGQVSLPRKLSASQTMTIPESYRGYRVEPLGAGLAVPELELAAANPQALYREVNTLLFRAARGRVDHEAEDRYASADLNGDGRLSELEVDTFARSISTRESKLSISGLLWYWGM